MNDLCLIVGAGPVGLMLANLLTKYGIAYRIIDQNPQPVLQTKAAGLWAKTLEIMHHLGYAEELLARAHRSYGAHIYSGGQERVQLNLAKLPSEYNFVTLIPQHETEAFLTEHLQESGITIERGLRLVQIEGNRATIEVVDGGASSTGEYRYIFGCDGAHSRVRKEIGATFQGEQFPGFWVVGDVIAEGEGLAPGEVSVFVGPEGPMAFFALGEGRYRIVAESKEKLDPVPRNFFEEVAGARVPFPLTFSDPQHMQMFAISERQADRYSNGTCFLLGDAAHIHSPAGGQGVNTGIQDAFNLAWKVAQVIAWDCNPALLESYHQERHPVAKRVLETTGIAMRVVSLSNPLAQKVRSAAMGVVGSLEPVKTRLLAGLSQLDIHYPESSLNTPKGSKTLKPGDRLPEVSWRDAKSQRHRLHDLLRGLHWTLVSNSDSGVLPEGVDSARLYQVVITRLGESTGNLFSDPAGTLVEALGLEPGQHLLVRPDGYVAGLFRDDAGPSLRDYWQQHCGRCSSTAN